MRSTSIRTVLVVSCAALALAACREDEGRAVNAVGYGVAPSALAYDLALAPDGSALPASRPAPVGQLVSYDDGYAWAERAYGMDRAFQDAPPDYGFEYEDVQPWVWESEDRWSLYAEPISDGYRYYYYEPGEAHPYFVRDDRYGYGYDDDGRLVTLYTLAGALLPVSYLNDRADVAGRYWTRARELRRASAPDRRARIDNTLWLARQPVIVRSQRTWIEAAEGREDWRAYRTRNEARDLKRFDGERRRREAVVARLSREELRRVEAREAGRDERNWAWSGERRQAEVREDRGGERAPRADRRQEQAQAQARIEGERRGREEVRARQEQRRLELAAVERNGRQETREREDRQPEARAQQDQRRERAAQAERQELQAKAQRGRQMAERERQGRQEAQVREREGRRQQQARAEGERRGREQVEARKAERQQAVKAERAGREPAKPQQQARQEARHAGQAGRDAGGRERGGERERGNRKD